VVQGYKQNGLPRIGDKPLLHGVAYQTVAVSRTVLLKGLFAPEELV
jgi:hypothetical protein